MKFINIKVLGLMVACCIAFSACGKNDAVSANNTVAVEEAENTAEETTETDDTATEESTDKTADAAADAADKLDLADGFYIAEFSTDSTMFHVNEVSDGKGVLQVTDGKGMIHIVLPSKNVLNLYPGLAEDAEKEGAELLVPTTEEVTYPDGLTEEVYAYDVPVPVIGEEFDLALIGKKEVWYDHKVVVSDPVPMVENAENADDSENTEDSAEALNDGEYLLNVTLTGGSGKSTVESPAVAKDTDEGTVVTIKWSSPHYDYMIVDDVTYYPVNTEGNSVFEIPFKDITAPVTVIADTVAMSTPHEIEYVLDFSKAE